MGMMDTLEMKGGFSPPGWFSEQLKALHDQAGSMPSFDVLEIYPPLDSSNLEPSHWAMFAREIESRYYDYDGFVIVQGTDTMSYTAAALSFMFENLCKPVILTGSMVPLSKIHNDARRNITAALVYAGFADVPEVCICFDSKLFRGNRTIKSSSFHLDAFSSPNSPPLASLDTSVVLSEELILPQPRGRFRVSTELCTSIAVCWLVPGFSDVVLVDMLASPALKGVVLVLYGTGNAPESKRGLLNLLHAAVQRGVVIVATSQCRKGTVDFEQYQAGKGLARVGVVSALDMTIECTVVKLAYALGQAKGQEAIRLLTQNLRGEMGQEENKYSQQHRLRARI